MRPLLLAIALACPRVFGSSNQEPSLDALIDLELPDAEADITGLLASPAPDALNALEDAPLPEPLLEDGLTTVVVGGQKLFTKPLRPEHKARALSHVGNVPVRILVHTLMTGFAMMVRPSIAYCQDPTGSSMSTNRRSTIYANSATIVPTAASARSPVYASAAPSSGNVAPGAKCDSRVPLWELKDWNPPAGSRPELSRNELCNKVIFGVHAVVPTSLDTVCQRGQKNMAVIWQTVANVWAGTGTRAARSPLLTVDQSWSQTIHSNETFTISSGIMPRRLRRRLLRHPLRRRRRLPRHLHPIRRRLRLRLATAASVAAATPFATALSATSAVAAATPFATALSALAASASALATASATALTTSALSSSSTFASSSAPISSAPVSSFSRSTDRADRSNRRIWTDQAFCSRCVDEQLIW